MLQRLSCVSVHNLRPGLAQSGPADDGVGAGFSRSECCRIYDRQRSGLREPPGRGSKPVNSGRPAQGAFLVDFSKGHDGEPQLLVDLDIDT